MTLIPRMAEMKAALAQSRESAAADARYKAALKHDPAVDPAKLERWTESQEYQYAGDGMSR